MPRHLQDLEARNAITLRQHIAHRVTGACDQTVLDPDGRRPMRQPDSTAGLRGDDVGLTAEQGDLEAVAELVARGRRPAKPGHRPRWMRAAPR